MLLYCSVIGAHSKEQSDDIKIAHIEHHLQGCALTVEFHSWQLKHVTVKCSRLCCSPPVFAKYMIGHCPAVPEFLTFEWFASSSC